MRYIATIILYGPRYYSSEEVGDFKYKLYEKGFTRDVPNGATWNRELTLEGRKIQQVVGLNENGANGQTGALYEYWASLSAIGEQSLPPQLEDTALIEFKRFLSKLGLKLVEEIKK